jgi:antitoxin VapB
MSIRDPRAAELADKLARRRGTTKTQAVIAALEAALEAERQKTPLTERLAAIADRAAALSQPGGRAMTKDEIDRMWGHD